MRENTEKWMELCTQAANEQDSQKLMALIREIAALLKAKRLEVAIITKRYPLAFTVEIL